MTSLSLVSCGMLGRRQDLIYACQISLILRSAPHPHALCYLLWSDFLFFQSTSSSPLPRSLTQNPSSLTSHPNHPKISPPPKLLRMSHHSLMLQAYCSLSQKKIKMISRRKSSFARTGQKQSVFYSLDFF